MAKYLASNFYVGDGSTLVWDVAFAGTRPDQEDGTEAYLDNDSVVAALITREEDGSITETPVSGELVGPSQYRIDPPVANGQEFKIYRSTQREYPLVDFNNFAALDASDLDDSARQALYVVQEIYDVTTDTSEVANTAAANALEAVQTAGAAYDFVSGAFTELYEAIAAIPTIRDGDLSVLGDALVEAGNSGDIRALTSWMEYLRTSDSRYDSRYDPKGSATAAQSFAIQRENHTGTQTASTISNPQDFSLVAGDGTALRNLLSYVSEGLNAHDFSAAGDGVADDTQALLDMGAAVGRISLARGSYKVTSTNIDVPIYFQPGASLLVEEGESVVIRNRIHSSVQYIFQGDGEYLINVESGGETGEDARVVHAGWFGVFPSNLAAIDVTARLQRCLNSLSGQTREGIVDTGQGSFHISGPLTVPRGVWLRGAGTRRTIFDITGDGYTVFSTEDDAVRFTDFQFEFPSGTTTSRDSAFIRLSHRNCEAWNLWLWSARFGIIVEGSGCSVRNIDATFGLPISSGGALILIRASNCLVDGVRQTSSSTGPDALVDVGSGASSAITNVVVRDVQSVCPSIPVLVRSTTSNVSGVSIDGVSCRITGSTIEAAVKVQTQSATSVSSVQISNVVGGASLENIVYLNQTSTGSMSGITIDGVIGSQSNGRGLYLRQTAGTLSGIHVGAACAVSHMETPVSMSGTVSDIRVSPGVSGEYQSAECYSFTLADDSAVQIRQRRTIFSGSAIITGASNQTGVLFIRVAPSPNVEIIAGGTNITPHDYALTGTTGVDGTLNVGADTLNLYIENRTGGTIPVSLSIFSGA